MARLLKLVSDSLLYSSSMSTGALPQRSVMLSVIAFHLASLSPLGSIIEHAEMAPALTRGVDGEWFSSNMAKMELKGRPVASAPIFSSTPSGELCFMARIAVGTFDTDSMPNR